MNREMINIYSDFLITTFGQASATNLSKALDNKISHDATTQSLSEKLLTSREYWKLVKPTIRQYESENAFIVIDDFILEKPSSEQNTVISYNFDHTINRSVMSMNIVNATYVTEEIQVPLDFEVVLKYGQELDFKENKWKRSPFENKNILFRKILMNAKANNILFKIVLADIWFSSSENMIFIKFDLGKNFIFPIKDNRSVRLMNSEQKSYQAVSDLKLEEGIVYQARLAGVPFVVSLVKTVFYNKDGSVGVLFLVSSLTSLSANEIISGYQKRWRIEEQHKNLKQNVSIGKSPTSSEMARLNHVFCAFVGALKLECLRLSTGLNAFALRSKLYIKALKASMAELIAIRSFNATL